MKKCSVLFAGLLMVYYGVWGQDNTNKSIDSGNISIAVVVPDEAGLSGDIQQIILGKMMQIASHNGLVAMEENARFAMVPAISILSQNVIPQAPPQMTLDIVLSLYVVDAMSQNIFSQSTIALRGLGNTQQTAYKRALNDLDPHHQQFNVFIEEAKEQIIGFYNSQCDALISASQALAAQEEYEEALFIIMAVPEVSPECYQNSLLLTADIYKSYADKKCEECLDRAKAAWAANEPGRVEESLGQITRDMDCYPQAQQMLSGFVLNLEPGEPGIEEFTMKEHDDQVDNTKTSIEAARDVAKTWARSGASKYFDWYWLYKN